MNSPAPRRAVVVMAKRPEAGATKTRLVPPLSATQAAGLAESFLLDAIALVRSIPDATPLVAIWPPSTSGYFRSVAPDVGQVEQRGSSLDERLDHVLTSCLDGGVDQVVAINADSPTLPGSRIADAFAALTDPDVDIVLGPAADGGYYLIGSTGRHSSVVRGVTMSTPDVLADTLDRASVAGVRVRLLDEWYDVDVPADLDRLEAELDGSNDTHTARFLGDRRREVG